MAVQNFVDEIIVLFLCFTLCEAKVCSKSKRQIANGRYVLSQIYYCCSDFVEINGTCSNCTKGYFKDPNSNGCNICPKGNYGIRCAEDCKCTSSQRCDHVEGCVPNEEIKGCDSGFTLNGTDCIPCPDDYYGDQCVMLCNCTNEQRCDNVYGCVRREYKECGAGYKLNETDCVSCPDFYYGVQCTQLCNCADDERCDPETGCVTDPVMPYTQIPQWTTDQKAAVSESTLDQGLIFYISGSGGAVVFVIIISITLGCCMTSCRKGKPETQKKRRELPQRPDIPYDDYANPYDEINELDIYAKDAIPTTDDSSINQPLITTKSPDRDYLEVLPSEPDVLSVRLEQESNSNHQDLEKKINNADCGFLEPMSSDTIERMSDTIVNNEINSNPNIKLIQRDADNGYLEPLSLDVSSVKLQQENNSTSNIITLQEAEDGYLEPLPPETGDKVNSNEVANSNRKVTLRNEDDSYLEPVQTVTGCTSEVKKGEIKNWENDAFDEKHSGYLHPYQPVLKGLCDDHKYSSTSTVQIESNFQDKLENECVQSCESVAADKSDGHKYTMSCKDIQTSPISISDNQDNRCIYSYEKFAKERLDDNITMNGVEIKESQCDIFDKLKNECIRPYEALSVDKSDYHKYIKINNESIKTSCDLTDKLGNYPYPSTLPYKALAKERSDDHKYIGMFDESIITSSCDFTDKLGNYPCETLVKEIDD